MRIVFRSEATTDLLSIITDYEEIAPEALTNILSDIHRSIDQLVRFPRIGTPIPNRTSRRLVTRRYHFKVIYAIGDGAILILGIFRYQDREV